MSKSSVFENKAFQQTSSAIGFNLVSQINSFNSVFDTKPLDSFEVSELETLLADNFLPETIGEEQVEKDMGRLKQITAEIKAIGRQGAILMGERVFMARDILKPYKEGTFTKWLEATFGARKTGYNALAYFDLYSSLPDDELREKFKQIPLRAAYVLASRRGDPETKTTIIREFHGLRHNELVSIIQEKLPVDAVEKKLSKGLNSRLIAQAGEIFKQHHERKELLSVVD